MRHEPHKTFEATLRSRDIFGADPLKPEIADCASRRSIGLARALSPASREAMPREYAITVCRSEKRPHGRSISLSWVDLARRLTDHEPSADKRGSNWSPFSFVGDKRKIENCQSASVLALDYDHSIQIGTVLDRLKTLGLAAIVATTHSHRADDPRFRVVFALDRPWRVSDYANDSATASQVWKAGIDRLTTILGAPSDQNAKDAARVFFDPRYPPDGPSPTAHILDGAPVNTHWLFRPGDVSERRPTPRVRSGEPAFVSMDELRSAVMAVPNDARFDRPEWIKFIGAIKHECTLHDAEDEGLELARAWSEGWTAGETDPDATEAAWDSLRADRQGGATGATVLRYALRNGWRRPGDEIPDSEFEDERERNADGKIVEQRRDISGRARDGKACRLKMKLDDIATAAALALSRTRAPLIDGLLDEGAMSVVYGPSNTGKTFVVLNMAKAVATGQAWNGMDTTRGLVVYVAAEGGYGVNQRLLALLREYEREVGEEAPKPLFALVRYPIDLRTDETDAEELCRLIEAEELVRGVTCAWVIVDTLSRAMSGGDENSSVDMGRIVQAADRIRYRTGAHFTFVHHTGKDVAKGARGHSSLRAATDTELEISNGSLTVEKQRDMRIMNPLAFSLKPVELGDDPNGRPVTSATVEWSKATSLRPASRLDEGEAAFVHAVESALEDHGSDKTFNGLQVRAVDCEKVREKFYAAYPAESTGSAKRSAFNRNKKSKAVATIVSLHDDGFAKWTYLNRDYVGFDMGDERAVQKDSGAFGKRSSGRP